MRRITSLLLTALMILSLFTVGFFTTTASAATTSSDNTGKVESGYTPTGTPITSEAEFLAMEADGDYYLANDITLTQTYGAAYNNGKMMIGPDGHPLVDPFFAGNLDGNGKTVTVSSPMFAYLDGSTIKNLTIKGTINFRSDSGMNLATHCGAIAMQGNDLTLENVSNTATVKGFETGKETRVLDPYGKETMVYESIYTGGMLGSVYGDLTVKNCVNWGDVTALCASGFVGSAIKSADNPDNTNAELNKLQTTVLFENCSNNGIISDRDCKDLKVAEGSLLVLKVHGITAGMLANGTATKVSFLNCLNTGDVLLEDSESMISFGGDCGGLSGHLERSDDLGNGMLVVYENCTNTATVIGARRVGGIGGYSNGSVTAINCVNEGDVTSRTNYAAGIVGRGGCDTYPNFVCDLIFEYCKNSGTITSHRQYAGGITGFTQDRTKLNYCLNTGDIRAEGVTKTSNNSAHNHSIDCGGMMARSSQSIELYYCVNTGNIISNFAAAGLASRIGVRSLNGVAFTGGYNTFFGCLSAGDVVAYNEKNLHSGTGTDSNGDGYCDASIPAYCDEDNYLADGETKGKDNICDKIWCKGRIGTDYHKVYYSNSIGAAGIINFSWGIGNKQAPRIFGCGVTANITASHGGTACAFLGYADTEFAMIEGNYFTGTLNGPDECVIPHRGTLRDDYCLEYATAWIDSCDSQKYIKENYYLESIKTSGAKRIMNNGSETDWAGYDCFITRDDIRTGKLCYLVNEAAYDFIGVYPFLQKLGTDLFPTSPYYYLTYTGTADTVSIDTIGDNIEIDYTYWVTEDGNGGYMNKLHIPSETTHDGKAPDDNGTTEPIDTGDDDPTSGTQAGTQAQTQPGDNANPGDNAGGNEDKGGCGSVVGASLALAVIALAAPAVIVLKKREDEE